MIELLLLLVGALALGGGSEPQRTKTKIPKPIPLPPPPTQSGMQPDPNAPDDPDRGRVFFKRGVPFSDLKPAKLEIQVAKLATTANGVLVVDVWITNTDDAKRCAALRWLLTVEDGRVMKVQPGTNDLPKCPAGSKPLKPPGAPFDGPILDWTQQGAWVVLLWETMGHGIPEDGFPGFSPENPGSTGFAVDMLWRFVS